MHIEVRNLGGVRHSLVRVIAKAVPPISSYYCTSGPCIIATTVTCDLCFQQRHAYSRHYLFINTLESQVFCVSAVSSTQNKGRTTDNMSEKCVLLTIHHYSSATASALNVLRALLVAVNVVTAEKQNSRYQ
jgi:hypothetical protein